MKQFPAKTLVKIMTPAYRVHDTGVVLTDTFPKHRLVEFDSDLKCRWIHTDALRERSLKDVTKELDAAQKDARDAMLRIDILTKRLAKVKK